MTATLKNTSFSEGHVLRQQHTTRGRINIHPADQEKFMAASIPRGSRLTRLILQAMSKEVLQTFSKPVAPYLGGKRNLAKRVCAIIDRHDHVTYAEPFVGMGGIFLRRKLRPKAEFINDAGRDVYNLFRILQEHYVAFLDLLRFQITTQANYNRLVQTDPSTLTDLQRAARFLYLQRCAFGGKVSGRNFGVSTDRPARFNITTLEPDLEALHSRLSGVNVMCLDYGDFIKRLDRTGVLFYLDPPYMGCEKDYGPDLFSPEDFAKIASLLQGIKGDFLMSINDTPDIRALFEWAYIKPVNSTYSVSKKAPTSARELLISNWKVE